MKSPEEIDKITHELHVNGFPYEMIDGKPVQTKSQREMFQLLRKLNCLSNISARVRRGEDELKIKEELVKRFRLELVEECLELVK